VSAVNSRLAPITGGNLGIVLPEGLELVSVVSTLGSCTGLSCALGTLAPGATAVVVYVLKAVTEGVKNLTLTLSQIDTDSLPLNNVVNVVTNITQPSTEPPAPDTTAPSLIMMLGKDKLATVSKKGLLAAVAWTEAGRLSLKVKLPGKVAKRLRLPTLIGTRGITTTKAGTAKIRLKVSKRAARKLARSKVKVRIIVKGQLRDTAGNVGKASASGTYKP
jgi:hypothetical protein